MWTEGGKIELHRAATRLTAYKTASRTNGLRPPQNSRMKLETANISEYPATVKGATVPKLREVRYCPECGSPLIAVPILQCAHCGEEIALRCFTFGPRRGMYFAECVDLDIAAQGKTLEQAIGKLQEAMVGYLETAFNGGSTKGLVLRPSPLSHRLRYNLRRLGHFLHVSIRGSKGKHLLPRSQGPVSVRLSHC